MPHRVLAWSLSAVLALVSLCACGGSGGGNGIASKSPGTIVNDAVRAAESARSVHIAGSVVRNGQSLGLDLDLQAKRGARGTISVSGLSFQFIQVPGVVYIKANRAFLRHFGSPTVMRLAGRWLRSSPNASGLGGFSGLTDLHEVFSSLLSSHGVLKKAGTTTFNGQSVVAVTDTTKGGTLYVASTGRPYPVGVRNSSQGELRLDHYNEPVSLTPPAHAVDLSQLSS